MSARPASRSGIAVYLVLALVVVATFLALSTPRLTHPGPYYDELHQAAPAFAYLGQEVESFALVRAFGLPLLNVGYTGAAKTALWGIYLRLSGRPFSLAEWRLFGLSLVAAGLFAFLLLARTSLGGLGLVLFGSFFVLDTNVLLCARHDWGPVALGLTLRLALIGTWLLGDAMPTPTSRNSFALGAVVGFAIFEKLSSVVLLGPLALMLLASPGRRNARHVLWTTAGLLCGSIPLLLANVVSHSVYGSFVSLSEAATRTEKLPRSLGELADYYLTLPWGELARQAILGGPSPSPSGVLRWLPTAPLVATLAIDVVWFRRERRFRQSLLLLCAYALVAGGLHLLPRTTWEHHWIIGTPFQYAAIALAGAGLAALARESPRLVSVSLSVLLFSVGVTLWPQLRTTIAVRQAIERGDATPPWDPDITKLGRFAARKRGHAYFIVTNWGLGTQIACLGNGEEGLSVEPFWAYHGPTDLDRLLGNVHGRDVYLVTRTQAVDQLPPRLVEASARIRADMARRDDWREVPLDAEVSGLHGIELRKYRWTGGEAGPG